MLINKILYSTEGKVIISLILGIAFITLFRKSCLNESCYNYTSTDLSELTHDVYDYKGSCYKFELKPEKCKNKKTVRFA